MKLTTGTLVLAVLGIPVIVVIGFAGLWWASNGLVSCGDTMLGDARSPGGEFVATAFMRNCGATTDFATIVSLRRGSAPFRPDTDSTAVVIDGACEVAVAWADSTELTVEHDRRCVIFSSRESVLGVRVDLRPK